MNHCKLLIVLTLSAAAMAQTPVIYNRGALNAASFMPQGLPGGAIARGSIFSIFGANLGPANAVRADSFPLGNTLGNVSITATQGSTTVNVIPIFVSAGQVNAILPSNTPLGTVLLRISNGGARSNYLPVRVAASAFGIFTATGLGVGPGILQNFIAADNQPINAPAVTATPGQAIVLWGTGLGPVTYGDNIPPQAVSLPTKVEVFVGGKTAPVLYSGRTPCCSGTDQVVFTVPSDAPTGCWVPVFVRTAGTTVSNVVTMGISADGTPCSDSNNPVSTSLVNGTKAGGFVALRATTRQDVGVIAPVDVIGDFHGSIGVGIASAPFPFSAAVSMPPPGTCTAYGVSGDLLRGGSVLMSNPAASTLDLGPAYGLSGPKGTRIAAPAFTGSRVGYFGGSAGNLIRDTLFLDPGTYTLTAMGGRDVGPFSSTFELPQPITWTNRDQLTVIDRTQPLNLAWTGGPDDKVVGIFVISEDLPTNSSAAVACFAGPGINSFSIPPVMLANLPVTRSNVLQSKGIVYLITLTPSLAGSAGPSGLDQAAIFGAYIHGKTVVFQ